MKARSTGPFLIVKCVFFYRLFRNPSKPAREQTNIMFVFSSKNLPTYHPRESSHHPDQLLLQLSIYGFSKLSESDQILHTKEIWRQVAEDVATHQLHPESNEVFRIRTFKELLKKLPHYYKESFITKLTNKFIHERQFGELVETFKHLKSDDQQKMIDTIVQVVPDKTPRISDEADEGLRLRRFTQLCEDHTDPVYKCLIVEQKYKYPKFDKDHIFLEKLQSSFSDFVSGFSTIWFQEQSSAHRKKMIENHLGGKVEDESEEGCQLENFKTLYHKKVVDFHTQVEFLHFANGRLLETTPHRRLTLSQDPDSATELLMSLAEFGFNLLFEKEQQDKIEEMSKKIGPFLATQETNGDFIRVIIFKELFSKLTLSDRIACCDELTDTFKSERLFCESILLFKHLGHNEQTELVKSLFDNILKLHPMSKRFNVIVEKLDDENEEAFRLRRFKKMYLAESTNVWNWFSYPEAEKLGRQATMQLHTNENKDTSEVQRSRYAEFYTGFAAIWYKARCANHPRNPVHVLLSGRFYEEDDGSVNLEDESEEGFRLRRFMEVFEGLEFCYMEQIVGYIKDTLFHDLGFKRINYIMRGGPSRLEYGRRGVFDPEFFKLKSLKLRGRRRRMILL